jgi:hypothetical protein
MRRELSAEIPSDCEGSHAFDLGWRLAGWFARSLPRRLLVPDGFSRAVQERGLQSGATKFAQSQKLIATKLIGATRPV